MNISVQSKALPITKALREFTHRQASKLNKLGQRVSSINVYLEKIKKKNNDPKAASVKYSVNLPGGVIVVRRKATDMYNAIVDATDGIIRRLRKSKEKRINKRR